MKVNIPFFTNLGIKKSLRAPSMGGWIGEPVSKGEAEVATLAHRVVSGELTLPSALNRLTSPKDKSKLMEIMRSRRISGRSEAHAKRVEKADQLPGGLYPGEETYKSQDNRMMSGRSERHTYQIQKGNILDPSLIDKRGEGIVSPRKKYIYGSFRPIMSGTVPDDWKEIRHHPNYKHGVVLYDHTLTGDEIDKFGLDPIQSSHGTLSKKEIEKESESVVGKSQPTTQPTTRPAKTILDLLPPAKEFSKEFKPSDTAEKEIEKIEPVKIKPEDLLERSLSNMRDIYDSIFKAEMSDNFSEEEAEDAGEKAGIDWKSADYDPKDLSEGMKVELEHKKLTGGDPVETAQIAKDHLDESPNYYDELEKMEVRMKKSIRESAQDKILGKHSQIDNRTEDQKFDSLFGKQQPKPLEYKEPKRADIRVLTRWHDGEYLK